MLSLKLLKELNDEEIFINFFKQEIEYYHSQKIENNFQTLFEFSNLEISLNLLNEKNFFQQKENALTFYLIYFLKMLPLVYLSIDNVNLTKKYRKLTHFIKCGKNLFFSNLNSNIKNIKDINFINNYFMRTSLDKYDGVISLDVLYDKSIYDDKSLISKEILFRMFCLMDSRFYLINLYKEYSHINSLNKKFQEKYFNKIIINNLDYKWAIMKVNHIEELVQRFYLELFKELFKLTNHFLNEIYFNPIYKEFKIDLIKY